MYEPLVTRVAITTPVLSGRDIASSSSNLPPHLSGYIRTLLFDIDRVQAEIEPLEAFGGLEVVVIDRVREDGPMHSLGPTLRRAQMDVTVPHDLRPHLLDDSTGEQCRERARIAEFTQLSRLIRRIRYLGAVIAAREAAWSGQRGCAVFWASVRD
jgi:hypothetical protein